MERCGEGDDSRGSDWRPAGLRSVYAVGDNDSAGALPAGDDAVLSAAAGEGPGRLRSFLQYRPGDQRVERTLHSSGVDEGSAHRARGEPEVQWCAAVHPEGRVEVRRSED